MTSAFVVPAQADIRCRAAFMGTSPGFRLRGNDGSMRSDAFTTATR
jgi:hypothetical protein